MTAVDAFAREAGARFTAKVECQLKFLLSRLYTIITENIVLGTLC